MSNVYTDILDSVKSYLATSITELSLATISYGTVQAVIDALVDESDNTTGCLLDFLYATPHSGQPIRNKDLWDVYIGGVMVFGYSGTEATEDAKENMIGSLMGAFQGGYGINKRLTAMDKINITRIERPQRTVIGERPFYFLPFTMLVNYGGT